MRIYLLIFLLVSRSIAQAQDYQIFTQTIKNFYTLTPAEIDKLWFALVAQSKIPLNEEDSIAFLFRGEAKSVMWMGDFNGWGSDKKFNNKGIQIPHTNIWILKSSFPKDARLDYKIVINESNWILDPVNPHQQWSGVGGGSPNSELRMPQWKEDSHTQSMAAIFRGRVQKDILINSEILGYQNTYSIYLPASYKPNSDVVYPVIYVTDGYEYMHEQMGNMTTTLDNLIYMKKIRPIIAIFIDHREPVNRSNNRRMQELAMNERYLTFVAEELIPNVEKQYPISTNPEERAILGTSLGGLAAAYFSFSKPTLFGLAGIESPAFSFRPDIYAFCDHPERLPVKTFMTTGLINDTREEAEKMKLVLDRNNCTYLYKEVNQGHSWGNFRDLVDDILIYFFPVN